MLPLIIGAVGLIAYGLFEENKKPKVANKMAKGGNIVDEELKEALKKVDGSNIFSQDFLDKYTIIKETFSSKKHDDAEKSAKVRKVELQQQGYAVKLKKTGFSDLARSDAYFITAIKKKYEKGGNINTEIDALYEKSGFINDDLNWEFKLIEMLQDSSSEAYEIYQKLNSDQKEAVLQELFSMNNDMGADGDGEIETSRENLEILLEDAKNGNKYARGGRLMVRKKKDYSQNRNPDIDKKYMAEKKGMRVSKKVAEIERRDGTIFKRRNANQYGKVKGGNTYYENRDNRTDKRIYLEKGGHVSKGEHVWKKLSTSEKIDFLYKNFTPTITPRSQELLVNKSYKFLPKNVKIVIESKYANVEL